MYLLNAFSLNMLDNVNATITTTEIDTQTVKDMLLFGMESAIGHQDTANVLSSLFNLTIPCNRASVKLRGGDSCIVAQYTGSRLPEGCTTLPEGSKFAFIRVDIAN